MLTLILMILALTVVFHVTGFSLRILWKILGGLIGMVIVFSIIGGMFGLIGTLIGLAAKVLPVALLVGLGILIGRSLNGSNGMGRDIRYHAQETIDSCKTRAQDLYRDIRNHSQEEVLDVDGKVIR